MSSSAQATWLQTVNKESATMDFIDLLPGKSNFSLRLIAFLQWSKVVAWCHGFSSKQKMNPKIQKSLMKICFTWDCDMVSVFKSKFNCLSTVLLFFQNVFYYRPLSCQVWMPSSLMLLLKILGRNTQYVNCPSTPF